MPTETATHIRVDERGVAWIDETNVKVIEVVLDQIAHRSSAEEIHFQYPHLSLAQIYAAFSYYHDHRAELDVQISEGAREYERLKADAGESPLQKRISGMREHVEEPTRCRDRGEKRHRTAALQDAGANS